MVTLRQATSFFKELGEFLWAVLNSWSGYTTGGIIVALLWLWSTLRQVPISRKIGIVLAVVFLLIAFFNAWREKAHLANAAQKQLEALTLPQLRHSEIAHSIGGGSRPEDALVIIAARIANKGAPTVLTGWKVYLKFDDGRTVDGQVLSDPFPNENFTLTSPSGKSSIVFAGAAYFPFMTRTQAITTTYAPMGWIGAIFPGLDSKDVMKQPHKIGCCYRDVNEKEWCFEDATRGQSEIVRPGDLLKANPPMEDKGMPKLQGVIEGKLISFGPISGNRTLLTMMPMIFNHGAPSVATDYKLHIVLPNGKSVSTSQWLPQANGIVLNFTTGKGVMNLPMSQYLPYRATVTPIPNGGAVAGFLTFIADATPEELDVKGTVITLGFTDVTGKPYSCSRTMRGDPPEAMFTPEELKGEK